MASLRIMRRYPTITGDSMLSCAHSSEEKCSLFVSNTVQILGFPSGAVVENLPAIAGDTGSSPGLGRSHMPWRS